MSATFPFALKLNNPAQLGFEHHSVNGIAHATGLAQFFTMHDGIVAHCRALYSFYAVDGLVTCEQLAPHFGRSFKGHTDVYAARLADMIFGQAHAIKRDVTLLTRWSMFRFMWAQYRVELGDADPLLDWSPSWFTPSEVAFAITSSDMFEVNT